MEGMVHLGSFPASKLAGRSTTTCLNSKHRKNKIMGGHHGYLAQDGMRSLRAELRS